MEEAVLELSAPAAMIGGMSSVQPPRGPLVGRAGELMRLAELVGLDGGESSTGVLLSGDAGVGKTRLLAAVRDRAESATWRVLVGHCLDLGDSAPPYLPFSEALGRFAAQEPVVADALAASRPAVGRLLPGAPRQRPGEGPVEAWTTDRSDLFESVHAALEQLARSAPVLLLIEDVHWADRSTREMLSFLFTRSFAADVTVVATYRSDDLHRRHPLRAVVAEWARLPAVSRLHLDPLEPRDIRVLVQALQPTPLPEQRVRDIIARSEGNAFFTEELVAAADRGDRALPVAASPPLARATARCRMVAAGVGASSATPCAVPPDTTSTVPALVSERWRYPTESPRLTACVSSTVARTSRNSRSPSHSAVPIRGRNCRSRWRCCRVRSSASLR